MARCQQAGGCSGVAMEGSGLCEQHTRQVYGQATVDRMKAIEAGHRRQAAPEKIITGQPDRSHDLCPKCQQVGFEPETELVHVNGRSRDQDQAVEQQVGGRCGSCGWLVYLGCCGRWAFQGHLGPCMNERRLRCSSEVAFAFNSANQHSIFQVRDCDGQLLAGRRLLDYQFAIHLGLNPSQSNWNRAGEPWVVDVMGGYTGPCPVAPPDYKGGWPTSQQVQQAVWPDPQG